MLSDIQRKVTSWDKNAFLDPSLTQRVSGEHASIGQPMEQQAQATATGIFGVKAKSIHGSAILNAMEGSAIYDEGLEYIQNTDERLERNSNYSQT